MTKATIYCPECRQTYTIKNAARSNERLQRQPVSAPQDGDWTVCEKCTAILIRKGGAFRAPTDQEWLDCNIEEQKLLKRAQEYFARMAKGETISEDEANSLLIKSLQQLPPEISALVPFLLARRMLGEEVDKAFETMAAGTRYTIGQITKRPDSTVADDVKCIVPCLMASLYVEARGDLEKTKQLLDEEINKGVPEGVDIEEMRKAGLLP